MLRARWAVDMKLGNLTPGVALDSSEVLPEGCAVRLANLQLQLLPSELQQLARQASAKFARLPTATLMVSRMSG